MQLFENITLAINGLRSNKMRALLTMLGIIIGIGSVIAIVTVGDAMTGSVESVFNDMGANGIQLYISDKPDEYGNTDWNRPYANEDYISQEMIDAYLERFSEEIAAWAVTDSVGPGQIAAGRRESNVYIYGTNAGALAIQNIDVVAGHDLNEREVKGEKNAAVVSSAVIEKLFPNLTPQQALGQEVKVRVSKGMYTFTIVGVYNYEVTGFAASMTGDTTRQMFIPVGVAKKMMTGDDVPDGYYALQVKGTSKVTDVQKFAERSEQFFNRTFYRGNKYVEIYAQNMDSMIQQMTGMMGTMKLAISVIAAISLLVGGIGVMNIMLVSVTERTREIGTRKALGAKNSAIRVQFIVESIIICMIGGVIGVLTGTTLGRLGSVLLGSPGWPSLLSVFVAVGFSMAIGVFFGYYPANKAAKLDPIEALRYE